jgi:hypothetical protein
VTKRTAPFLILGSGSPDLIRGASETLAGRVAFVYPGERGFRLDEKIEAVSLAQLAARLAGL